MEKNLTIVIGKKELLITAFLSIFFIGLSVVIAYNTNNPLILGHSAGEVDVTVGGVTKSLQTAVNDFLALPATSPINGASENIFEIAPWEAGRGRRPVNPLPAGVTCNQGPNNANFGPTFGCTIDIGAGRNCVAFISQITDNGCANTGRIECRYDITTGIVFGTYTGGCQEVECGYACAD